MSDFTHRVWDVVRQVPHGCVVSYGGVAAILGRPRAARGVGHALSVLGENSDVPWWRVINRNGEISIRGPMHGAALQRALLEREGVRFVRGRVDWRRFGWNAEALPDGVRGDPERTGLREHGSVREGRRRRR